MNFGSVDEILQFAVDREKEAVEFYTGLSEKETFSAAKETFINFAKEEQKHVDLISDIKGNQDKIDSYELKEITDLKISDYMVEKEYEPGMIMSDILRIAMKKEEAAVKLYNELASQSGDAQVEKVFKMLAQEEAQHKLFLESMYDDYLADHEG
ncbi:MAG: rubrerythrin [Desulfobacteraceae bacterium]|mgnify:CR=1 FL=1|nr:MAG: rubrerythrin [Desulfobacteraceae bacterium]